jgi:hypothetical protein
MGVTRCNRKTIVQGSGRYHSIGWNVAFSTDCAPTLSPTLQRRVPPLSRTSAREAVRQAAHGARRKEPL